MKAVDYSQKTFDWLLDTVFPPRCIGCHRLPIASKFSYLCRSCFRTIPLRQTFECIGCKMAVKMGVPCTTCAPFTAIDRLLIASTYQDRILKRLVINYKYKFVRELEISLGSILRKYIALLMHQHRFNLFSQSPIITAVPLHSYRQRWRGFNQAEVLAQGLAGTYQMDFLPVLRKIKRTTPQAQLEGRDERLDHWEGVFICTDHGAIRGKDIILIDDICTTGATLDACAEVLKENGAKTVTALVVARG